MAYEKQTWISYDDNKTEEENIETGAVVTAERMNHIEDGVEAQATKIEFDAHLDDKENPHEVTAHQVGALTAEETSANVIDQIIGKENAKINITLDYQNKIAGSVVENPHKAAAGFSSVIPTPAQVTGEVSQNAYNALSALDGDVTSPYTATNKDMTYFLVQWNVLEALERELGSKFFIDRGATTTKEKVEIARTILTVINPAFWGYGKSPSGNKLNFQIWINNSSWAGTRSHNASTVTKMEYNSTGTSTNNYLSDDGYLYASAYAEPSDGTAPSTVVGDYAQLNLQIEISANDHIESKIAAYSGENIDKKFVGLENVDNYETATQVDAESGTATDKFMTPLRTKQHVDKRIATKAEAEAGTSEKVLMNPKLTKDVVKELLATSIFYGADGEVSNQTKVAKYGFGSGYTSTVRTEEHFTRQSNGYLKCNKAGTYLITAQIRIQIGGENNTYMYTDLCKNDVSVDNLVSIGVNGFKNRFAMSGTLTVTLTAGDILSIQTTCGTDVALSFCSCRTVSLQRIGD